jgi:hypothetical protein
MKHCMSEEHRNSFAELSMQVSRMLVPRAHVV